MLRRASLLTRYSSGSRTGRCALADGTSGGMNREVRLQLDFLSSGCLLGTDRSNRVRQLPRPSGPVRRMQ